MTMKWNEWLVCKVVASALWIIQGMLSNFHAPTLLFKGENLSKETYGTKQNVEDCEIGILKCISYLYSAYLKKWFEAYKWIYPQNSFLMIITIKSPGFPLFPCSSSYIQHTKHARTLCLCALEKVSTQYSWI